MSINVILLNTPMVQKEEMSIAFPFRKAEALFYYLAVNKQATRDELVDILWADMDNENAKKNLRHTMYKLRKAFDMDIIISPQKSTVMLNPSIPINIDVDRLISQENDDIESYKGEFLQGFYVKDAEEFDEWMIQQREYIKNIYIQKINNNIETELKKKDYIKVEYYCKCLIAEDPFDERAYRMLMEIYGNEGAFPKVVDTYSQLNEMLKEELGISPDKDTITLYNEIMTLQNIDDTDNNSKKTFFYDRRSELNKIRLYYNTFMENKQSKSILILGEAGIGKTKLKDYFLDTIKDNEVYFLESNCYQAEEEYFFKPWNNVFERLAEIIHDEKIEIPLLWTNVISYVFPIFQKNSNTATINPAEKIELLKYQAAEEAVVGVLKKVSLNRKIVLIFDDLQWMDKMSLRLLSSIIHRRNLNDIFFIFTCRNGYEERVDKFITSAIKYDLMEKVEIDRFTPVEVEDFAKQALPSYRWTKELIEKLYHETEGNTFFLVEMINSIKNHGEIGEMSSKMQDIIKSRFLDLSKGCKKIVNIASLFFDRFSLEIIKSLSGKDELEIIDIIEELQKRFILKESGDGINIYYEFTHQKLRDYVYMNQSMARKKILHNKIGQILEKSLQHSTGDRFVYPKLIYHFKNGGDRCSTLKYLMKNLDNYFNLSHELFPILNDGGMVVENYYHLDKEKAIKQLEEIELLLNEVKDAEGDTSQIKTYEMTFLHMKGRYLIYEGQYTEGLDDINKMIALALEKKDWFFAVKGYRQMIYYCIQTYHTDYMRDNIHKGLELAISHGLQKETGILLRLKGLYETMCGKYQRAEETLKQSIGIFQAINQYDDKYSLNIAAGYNYIGEIRRYNMKFSSALDYYDKAMAICEEKSILRGLGTFNCHAGQAALDMGDYLRGENYLKKAIKYYNQLDTLWGRSTAEGYFALLLIKEGNYKGALEHLKNANTYAEKLQSPYEMGLVYRVKAEIKASMKKNSGLKQVFANYLTLELEAYCNKGIELLKSVEGAYEVDILKALKKNKG